MNNHYLLILFNVLTHLTTLLLFSLIVTHILLETLMIILEKIMCCWHSCDHIIKQTLSFLRDRIFEFIVPWHNNQILNQVNAFSHCALIYLAFQVTHTLCLHFLQLTVCFVCSHYLHHHKHTEKYKY